MPLVRGTAAEEKGFSAGACLAGRNGGMEAIMRRRRLPKQRQNQGSAGQYGPSVQQLDLQSVPGPSRAGRRQRRREEQPGPKHRLALLQKILVWTFQILVMILFAYIAVLFFGQSRTNIGQSMEMTLQGGDIVLINTFSYQINRPERGDIISFRPNGSETAHSNIKRVIGLPGETVQIKEGIVYIDGQVLMEEGNYPTITNPGMAEKEVHLGRKEYFVLGDNRNNSVDSRFADIGAVNIDHIEGKVWMVLSPSENRRLLRS